MQHTLAVQISLKNAIKSSKSIPAMMVVMQGHQQQLEQ
jgi:hypothetical protein